MKKLTPFLLLLLSAPIVAQQPEPVSVKTVVAVAEDKDKEPTVADTIKPSVEEKKTLTVPKKVEKVSSMTSRLGINAGQTRTLTLNQAIRLALSNNNTIAIGRDDVRIAESQLRSLEGFYDPSFTVNPSYDRNQTNGQSATNDLRFNSSFNGQVKNGGGDYSIFFNNTRTENAFAQSQATAGNFSGNSSSALYFSTLGVRFSQPLLRDFAVDSTRRQIKIQKKRVAQSDADFRRQSIEVISQVQRAYWDLVFALRDQQNRVANLNLTKENLRQVEARIKAGAAAPLQRAEVNTELANRESDLLVATQQVSIAENALKQLLLKDAGASEWSESLVPTDKPVFSSEPVNLQNALKDAVANRPELSRLRLEKEINEIDRKFFSNQTKPRLDLTSTFSLNGIGQSGADSTTSLQFPLISGDPNSNANAFLLQELQRLSPTTIDVPNVLLPPTPTFLTGGYSQAFRNIFRNDSRNFSLGVTFTIPLRNTTAEADLATAKFQESRIESQMRSQEQSIIAEVRNAVQAVETARKRVLAARKARENAEIQLEGERKLYDVGRSTTFLLFQRENTLTNARNSEIRSETDYNKALADLQRVTSTTLTTNNVVVDSGK